MERISRITRSHLVDVAFEADDQVGALVTRLGLHGLVRVSRMSARASFERVRRHRQRLVARSGIEKHRRKCSAPAEGPRRVPPLTLGMTLCRS